MAKLYAGDLADEGNLRLEAQFFLGGSAVAAKVSLTALSWTPTPSSCASALGMGKKTAVMCESTTCFWLSLAS
jgi:hypothetical protein